MAHLSIDDFHASLAENDLRICERLRAVIDLDLPEADSKIWHGHPVWFLDGNPIVGYSKLKDCVRLMFWSGQSFAHEGLRATGSFKAAEVRYSGPGQVDDDSLMVWLAEAREIQWDYKNIAKRKGRLDRLK